MGEYRSDWNQSDSENVRLEDDGDERACRGQLAVAAAAGSRLGIELRLPEPVSGPFRYGDIDWFFTVLGEVGWVDVHAVESQMVLYVGGPGTSPTEAAALGMGNGRLAVLTARLDALARVEIDRAVAFGLEQAWDDTGVRLAAGISIVTPRRPRGDQ